MSHVHLPSKNKALSSTLSSTKANTKQTKQQTKGGKKTQSITEIRDTLNIFFVIKEKKIKSCFPVKQ
jgi:hypothetical protein